jgi:hypothetical protein
MKKHKKLEEIGVYTPSLNRRFRAKNNLFIQKY